MDDTQPTAEALIEKAIDALTAAVAEREHPWRFLSMASVDEQGRPHNRELILRGYARTPMRLTFFTDARSAKVEQLRSRPWVSLCAYSALKLRQVILRGHVTLEYQTPRSRQLWETAPLSSLLVYRQQEHPGLILSAPFLLKEEQDPEAVYGRFCVIDVWVDEMEVLQLHPAGNQRALAMFDAEGRIARVDWTAP